MKNLYRIALLFILLLAPVFIIGQNHHWNIALNFHTAMELSHQSESAGINEKYRNKSQTGNSSGFGLSIIRRIKAPWYVGVEIGRLNARYKLHLDRDFGDLNRIIGFSEPTIEGDYQNIDQIEYNNIYYRWAVCSYYYLNDNPEQTVQTYLGLGYEQRHLNKSDSQATYRDFTNYVFLSEEEINNIPTPLQKTEANAYYDEALANPAAFFNIKVGFKIKTSENFAFLFEPYFTTSFKNYQPKFLDSQTGLGINFMLNISF